MHTSTGAFVQKRSFLCVSLPSSCAMDSEANQQANLRKSFYISEKKHSICLYLSNDWIIFQFHCWISLICSKIIDLVHATWPLDNKSALNINRSKILHQGRLLLWMHNEVHLFIEDNIITNYRGVDKSVRHWLAQVQCFSLIREDALECKPSRIRFSNVLHLNQITWNLKYLVILQRLIRRLLVSSFKN